MSNNERSNAVIANVSAFIRDESGQDLIEYALVAAIIALGCDGGHD